VPISAESSILGNKTSQVCNFHCYFYESRYEWGSLVSVVIIYDLCMTEI
jgi:hypothetical protein